MKQPYSSPVTAGSYSFDKTIHPPQQLTKLLRPKAAAAYLGISRTQLWRLSETDPAFPPKVILGPRCIGWRLDALRQYITEKEHSA